MDQGLEDTHVSNYLVFGGKGGRPSFDPLYGGYSKRPVNQTFNPSDYRDVEDTGSDTDANSDWVEEKYLESLEAEGRKYASFIFRRFISRSRYWNALGRCKRCGQEYFNLSGQARKTYCSQKCASKDSAVRATSQRYQNQRMKKLERIRKAIKSYEGLTDKGRARVGDWKQWVVHQVKKNLTNHQEEVKVSFITRAINGNDLKPPRGTR
jgi:hypothetical protein